MNKAICSNCGNAVNGYVTEPNSDGPADVYCFDCMNNTEKGGTSYMEQKDKGLYVKYEVTKIEDGSTVNNSFVLLPDHDPAAIVALRAYAEATTNATLRCDILAWLFSITGVI